MNTKSISSRPQSPEARHAKSRSFLRLLVAVDSSQQGQFAAQTAAQLARQLQADIVLVHVFWAAPYISPNMGFLEPEVRNSFIESATRLLERTKREMGGDLQIATIVREGEPISEILETAALYSADMIVVGTHGRGRVARCLLGSVAHAVLRQAKCPVITVTHPPAAPGKNIAMGVGTSAANPQLHA